MSEALPSRVDALRLAGRGAVIRNVTPLVAMPRLTALLVDADGEVESELAFAEDASGRNMVSGRATTTVRIVCQRCLEPLTLSPDARVSVAVVDDDAELERLPDDIEGVTSEDGGISPLALVEDELILALPDVAMHEDCTAPIEAAPAVTDHSNPFAALAELKNRER